MARDRWSTLALHAQSRGLIDYDKIDVRNPLERQREIAVLQFVEDDLNLKLLERGYQQALTLLGSASGNNIEARVSRVQELFERQGRIIAPWLPWDKSPNSRKISRGEVADLTARWEEKFGSLDSPDTKAKLKSLAELSQMNQPVDSDDLLKHVRRL